MKMSERYSRKCNMMHLHRKRMAKAREKEQEEKLIFEIPGGNYRNTKRFVESYGFSYISKWSDGYILLCYAIKKNDREFAILLINSGVVCSPIVDDFSYQSYDTPLHLAVNNNDLEIVNMLLKKSVDVNLVNQNGLTAIHIAVDKNYVKMTQQLLKFNINLNLCFTTEKYGENYTLPYLVLIKNNEEIINSFNNKSDYNFSDDLIILNRAFENINLKIIKKLFDFGADINNLVLNDINKLYDLLYLTLIEDDEKMINILSEIGNLDITYNDVKGKKSLLIAFERRNLKMMERFIIMGADVNDLHSNELGEEYSLLYLALENNYLDACILLLNKNNDIKPQGLKKRTPLHLAIEKEYKEVVEKILNQLSFSPICQENYELLNATYHFSIIKNSPEIVNLYNIVKEKWFKFLTDVNNIPYILQKYSEKKVREFLRGDWALHRKVLNEVLITASSNTREKIVEESLKYGADVNYNGICGNSSLHIAVKKNHEGIFNLLLEYGANVNNKNNEGETPFHLALNLKRHEFVSILLDFDAYYCTDYYNYRYLNSIINITLLNHNLSDSEVVKLQKVFISYFLKRNFANLSVDSKIYEIIIINPQSNLIIQQILNEIRMMKIHKIADSNISFYHIFKSIINPHRLVRYIANADVEKELESRQWNSLFPIYYHMIKNAFIKAKKRKFLLDQVYSFTDFNLPSICMDLILHYLTDDDLKLLIEALKT